MTQFSRGREKKKEKKSQPLSNYNEKPYTRYSIGCASNEGVEEDCG